MSFHFKKHLRGGLEYCLFMPNAVEYFKQATLKDVLLSFLPPLLLIPYGIYGMTLTHGTELQELSELEGINNFSTLAFIGITSIKSILLMVFALIVMYYFAKGLNRADKFYSYVCAGNWVILPGALFSLPLFLMVLAGGHEWTVVYFVATITIIYGLAVSAFLVTYALNIPWELGGAITIFFLFVSEAANKFVNVLGNSYGI